MRKWTSAYCCWIVETHECAVGGCTRQATDPDHIHAKGMGGRKQKERPHIAPIDEKNVMPLCRECHTERHQMGVESFYYDPHRTFRYDPAELYADWMELHSTVWEEWHRKAFPQEELAE